MGVPPTLESPLALGEVREAAARLGFAPVPGTSMAVLAARQGAGIAGAVLLPLIPSIHPVRIDSRARPRTLPGRGGTLAGAAFPLA